MLPDADAEVIRAQCQGVEVRQIGTDAALTVGTGSYSFKYAPTTPYRKFYSLDSSWADIKANPSALAIVLREFRFKEDHIPFEKELCMLREMSWSPFTSMTQAQRDRIDGMLREVE